MNALVVVAHPNPASLNHAIARTAAEALRQAGHRVAFRDLYAGGPDPRLPFEEIPDDAPLPAGVDRWCRELRQADGIVVVHPNWWGMPPAAMKGWIDRAFRPGVAYRFLEGDAGEGVPVGLLRARAAAVFNTANTPAEREDRVFGDPLETLWRNCIFGLCGVGDVHREVFRVVVTSTPAQRAAWLGRVREVVARLFPPGGSPSPGRHPPGG